MEEDVTDVEDHEFTIDHGIDQIGWGPYQWKLLLIIAISKGSVALQLILHSMNLQVMRWQ